VTRLFLLFVVDLQQVSKVERRNVSLESAVVTQAGSQVSGRACGGMHVIFESWRRKLRGSTLSEECCSKVSKYSHFMESLKKWMAFVNMWWYIVRWIFGGQTMSRCS
jgi:hypothetical protein